MGKALKFFVVLNLLVSAAVVALGVMTFNQRQVVKGRAYLLERNVAAVAENLNWGGEVAWEEADERKPGSFTVPQPAAPDELDRMDNRLDDLASFATQRVAQLTQRYGQLVQTRRDLRETRDTLRIREGELADARNRIEVLTKDLADTREDLRQANQTIGTLESEKEELERRVDDLNDRITTNNNRIATLEVDLETRIQQRNNAEARYLTCRKGAAGPGGGDGDVRGKAARVLAVNPSWEYVVISKGAGEDVQPETEAFVHRGRDYIGKLQVVRVEEDMAIAKIKSGSVVENTSIKPGDTLFF